MLSRDNIDQLQLGPAVIDDQDTDVRDRVVDDPVYEYRASNRTDHRPIRPSGSWISSPLTSSAVRPITPRKVVPGSHSTFGIEILH
jgi:hypothetical protein